MDDDRHGHWFSKPFRMNLTDVCCQTKDVAQIVTVTQ